MSFCHSQTRASCTCDADATVPRGDVRDRGQASSPSWGPASTPSARGSNASVSTPCGRVLMPGFVDAHTHALFAGDRLHEFELTSAGQELPRDPGGGRRHPARRCAPCKARAPRTSCSGCLARAPSAHARRGHDQHRGQIRLRPETRRRARRCCAPSAAAAGVSRHARRRRRCSGTRSDASEPHFVDRVDSTRPCPPCTRSFPASAIDAFCERGPGRVDDCRRLLDRARELGHPLRLHTDQFNATRRRRPRAGARRAAASTTWRRRRRTAWERIAHSATFGVMLPVSGFHTDQRYAAGRAFMDAGGKLVLASNYNPGSSPCFVHAVRDRARGA